MRPLALLSLSLLTAPAAEITHGPILGRLSSNEIGVWARTARPGEFHVEYGTQPTDLGQKSATVRTVLDHDNAGFVHITGLAPNTKYFYKVMGEAGQRDPDKLYGDFKTLPDRDTYRHAKHNPDGLFNFSFEYACGNNQGRGAHELPTFTTMLREIEDKVDFAILDGDWLYEEKREYTPAEWRTQVGAPTAPRIVDLAPTIVGVWENYKLYLSRGKPLADWHREMPSFFMFDDHEMLNDVNGTGTIGLRSRRASFRDIGTQAWYDYLGWSNPVDWKQGIHFGKTRLKAGSDVLEDSSADFRELKLNEAGTLVVHWGTEDAGVNQVSLDNVGGDPNAGVYEVKEVLGRNRLRISPTPKTDSEVSYSIGRLSHFRMTVANAEYFFVDTRSHRQMHDINDPFKEGVSILGEQQKAWLKKGMSESKADFLFIVSSVNLMVPHILAGPNKRNKDEAWTAVAAEREELIEFWDSVGKPVFVLTGDLHNSFAIKLTDRVWEFASGPHNSSNHILEEEWDRPSNGPFESRGREVDIRWSTFIPNDAGKGLRRPIYTVVRVNNAFRIPKIGDQLNVWAAYARPHVTFQYYDGLNGDLLYAETIHATRP